MENISVLITGRMKLRCLHCTGYPYQKIQCNISKNKSITVFDTFVSRPVTAIIEKGCGRKTDYKESSISCSRNKSYAKLEEEP